MNVLEELASCTGAWQGMNRLHDPFTGVPDESSSALTVTRKEGGAVELAYTWAYEGKTQHGTLLLREAAEQPVTAVWNDTWHTASEMHLREEVGRGGPLALLGAYAAPSGPDWGWRIVLEPGEPFRLRMDNLSPEGEESVAVEASYDRNAADRAAA